MKTHPFLTHLWCHASGLLLAAGLSAAAAELVEPRSGQLIAHATDLAFDAGAVRIELHRTLQPQGGEPGLLGTRWRMDWETRLVREAGGVSVHRGFIREAFAPAGPGFRSVDGSTIAVAADGSATRQNPDGTRDEFSTQGRLTARELRNGNRLTFAHDASGRLARVAGPRQSSLTFLVDETGRLARVESSTGEVVRYQFERGELSAVDTTRQPALRYGYTPDGLLARIESVPGGAQVLAYDLFGRVVSHAQANGVRHFYEYDDATRTTRRTDSSGRVTVMSWSADGLKQTTIQANGAQLALEYDAAGRLVRSVGPDGTEGRFSYDSRGRLLAAQNISCCSGQMEYDGDSPRPKLVVSPEGVRTELAYDAQGNLTRVSTGGQLTGEMTWTSDGLPATERDVDGRSRRYAYDAAGRLASTTDNLNRTTRFEYDDRGNLLRTINAAGGATAHTYDRRSRLLTTTDPVGAITRYAYDDAGQLVSVTDSLGRETRHSYNADGSLAAVTDAARRATRISSDPVLGWTRLTSPEGLTTTERVGDDGQLTEVTDVLGRVTRYTYDAAGQITSRQSTNGTGRYTYDAGQRMIASESPESGRTTFQWDAQGRLAARTDAAGGSEKFAYDASGRLTAQTDARGGTRRIEYSAGGQLTALTSAGGERVRLEYDAAGQVAQVVHPRGAVSKFRHGALDLTTELSHPAAGTVRREFDAAGRLTATTDALGRMARFAYDAAGRLTRTILPGGEITRQYGPGDELLRVDDGKSPLDYQYDAAGNLSQVSYGALKRSVQFRVNRLGSRTALVASDGRIIRYEYDGHERLVKILLPSGGAVAFTYDHTDRVTATKYPNGTSAQWTYDPVGRVKSLAWKNPAGQPLASWDYRHDAAGNPVAVARAHGPALAFNYDADGRLTSEQRGTAATTYTYLPGGDRSGRNRDGFKYDANERLASAGDETFTHDAAGQPVTRTGPKSATRYEWDTQGRLARATTPGGDTVQFGYAPTSERIWREDKNGRVYFLHDGPNLLEELDARGSNVVLYVHGPDLDRPVAMTRGGQTYFFHHDPLGTVDLVTDAAGQVVARHDVDAFGVVARREGAVASPFLFGGREYDAALGLYYFRARYYDPSLGRFLTPDPEPPAVFEAGDLNRYAFARNAPTRFGDPLGMAAYDFLSNMRPDQASRFANSIRSRLGGIPRAQMTVADRALYDAACRHVANVGGLQPGPALPVPASAPVPAPGRVPVSGGVPASAANPSVVSMAANVSASAPHPVPPAPVPPAAPVPGTAGPPVNSTGAAPVSQPQAQIPRGQTVRVPSVTPTPTFTPGQLLAGAGSAAGVGAVVGGVDAYTSCLSAGLSESECRRRGAMGAVAGGAIGFGAAVAANALTAVGAGAVVTGAAVVGTAVAAGVVSVRSYNAIMQGAGYLAARDREARARDRLAAMGQRLNNPAQGGATLDALRSQVANLRKELEAIRTAGGLLMTTVEGISAQNKSLDQIVAKMQKIAASEALKKAAEEGDKTVIRLAEIASFGKAVDLYCNQAVNSLEQSAPGKWPASEASLRRGDAELKQAEGAYRQVRTNFKEMEGHLATARKLDGERAALSRPILDSTMKATELTGAGLRLARELATQREQWSRQRAGLQMSVKRLLGIAADPITVGIVAAIGNEVDKLALPDSPIPERVTELIDGELFKQFKNAGSEIAKQTEAVSDLLIRTLPFDEAVPAAQEKRKDADTSVFAATFVLARHRGNRNIALEDLAKKLIVINELDKKADQRDTALKNLKAQRETELKKPNLPPADREKGNTLVKQIDQEIVKNQDQKAEATRQAADNGKTQTALSQEIKLLDVSTQRVQKTLNEP